MFDFSLIVAELQRHKEVFHVLLTRVAKEMQTWRPAPEKWCLLEIICHLADEENEDFRARVRHILTQPEAPLPPIDPVGWVKTRNYMSEDFGKSLQRFEKEREKSLQWLRSLSGPAWNNAYIHPKFGPMSAKMIMTNWLAHDYLHLRQITRIKYQYLEANTGEDLRYAGAW